MKKYLVTFVIILTFCMMINVFGSYATTVRDWNLPHIAKKVANEWIKDSYKEFGFSYDKIEIDEMIPVYNGRDYLEGYCVSFKHKNQSVGYVLLDLSVPISNSVIEFAFDGTGLYDAILNYADKECDVKSVEKKIYSPCAYLYAIEVSEKGEKKFFSTVNGFNDKKEYKKKMKDITDKSMQNFLNMEIPGTKMLLTDGIYSFSELPGYTTSINHITGLPGFVPRTSTYFDADSSGNCTPTAMMNAIRYYKECKGFNKIYWANNEQWAYDRIVAWLEVGGYANNDGSLKTADITTVFNYGYNNYLNEVNNSNGANYAITIDKYKYNYWSDFTRDIGLGYPILVYFMAYTNYSPTDNTKIAHEVLAVGYCTRRVGDDNIKYLNVYDGWSTSTTRYMKFDYYLNVQGHSINITSS